MTPTDMPKQNTEPLNFLFVFSLKEIGVCHAHGRTVRTKIRMYGSRNAVRHGGKNRLPDEKTIAGFYVRVSRKRESRFRMLDKIWSVIVRAGSSEGRRGPSFFDSMPEQSYTLETEQETDGRWIAEIPELPGVMAYGATLEEATAKAEAIAFRVIADRLEQSKVATSKVSFAQA